MKDNNRTLEIKILSESDARKAAADRFSAAWESAEYSGEYLTFTSPAGFFEVLNSRRWDLVVKLLMTHGIIEQDGNGVCVPYDTIHADFTLSAAHDRAISI